MSANEKQIRRWRIWRAVIAVLFAANLAMVAPDALGSHYGTVALNVVIAAFLLTLITSYTMLIRRPEVAGRPQPDYSLIAAMEREVYGRTFKHDRAPGTPGKRSCCDTPLSGGHRGTCRNSLMNGGKFEEEQ